MIPKKDIPIKWAEPEMRIKSSEVNTTTRHYNTFLPDLDFCYVYDMPQSDPKEESDTIQQFARNHKNLMKEDPEIAGMYVLRDINTIENLIDFSYTPHCWHIMNYDNIWDPKVYRKLNAEMNAKRSTEQEPEEDYDDNVYASDGQLGSTTTSENR